MTIFDDWIEFDTNIYIFGNWKFSRVGIIYVIKSVIFISYQNIACTFFVITWLNRLQNAQARLQELVGR